MAYKFNVFTGNFDFWDDDEVALDARYVNVTGDTMTGDLTIIDTKSLYAKYIQSDPTTGAAPANTFIAWSFNNNGGDVNIGGAPLGIAGDVAFASGATGGNVIIAEGNAGNAGNVNLASLGPVSTGIAGILRASDGGVTEGDGGDAFISNGGTGGIGGGNGGNVTLGKAPGTGTHGTVFIPGDLSTTGERVTKGWFIDLEVTNMPTIGGVDIQDTFVDVAGDTMTGDLSTRNLTPVNNSLDSVGLEADKYARVFAKQGIFVSGSGTLDLQGAGKGGLVVGSQVGGGGTETHRLTGSSGYNAVACMGVTWSYAGSTAILSANRGGSSVIGAASSFSASGNALVETTGFGSLAMGYSYGNGDSTIRATNSGSVAMGYSRSSTATTGVSLINSSGNGSFVQGMARNHTGSNTATLTSAGAGTFAQGYSRAASTGNTTLQSSGAGSFAQGLSRSQTSATTALTSVGIGSFAQGGAYAKSGSSGFSNIRAKGNGAFSQGYSLSFNTGHSYIYAQGNGTFAQGSARSNSATDADIHANGSGAFAQGYANNATISATFAGAFAQGAALSDSVITATALGAMAAGYAKSSSTITASFGGAIAHGYASGGIIDALGGGTFAQGVALNATIQAGTATKHGAFAMGFALTGDILATESGSFALGLAQGNAITASATGSFAQGNSASGVITASANNAAQFGPGTNATADSLQVGSGVLLEAAGHITSTGKRIKNTTRYTTTQTIPVTDHIVFANTDGGAWTATLPAGVEGQTFKIINSGASGNTLTIAPNGAEHLLGVNSSFTLNDAETLEITYNATDGWY